MRRCRWEWLLRARLSGCDSSSGQARRFETLYFFLLTPMLELEITEVGVSGGGGENLVSFQRASPLSRVHYHGI